MPDTSNNQTNSQTDSQTDYQTDYQVATKNLKRVVKERGLTYLELAQGIGLSESGVKKIFLAKDGSFQRLAQICRYIGISMGELLADHRTLEVDFSRKQQQEFLKDPILFQLYWLLVYERRSIANSQEALKLSKPQTFRLLRRLDHLGMLKLLPGDRLRIPSVKAVRWTGEGEFIRKLYRDWSRSLLDTLGKSVTQTNEFFLLRYLQMTPQTYSEFREALRGLEEEFVRRSIHEMRTKPAQVGHVRWLVGADNRSFLGVD